MASFFDKVITGINNGATSISEGSKTMVEKAKLNTGIHNAEEEKKKLAGLLGAQTYNLFLNGVELPADLQNFCLEMQNRDNEIAAFQASLAALDTKTASVQPSTIPGGKVCTCGFTNNPEAVFCAKCGNKIG